MRPISETRRTFLRQAAGGALATAVPAFRPDSRRADLSELAQAASRVDAGSLAEEPFWEMVRAQFPLRSGLVLMNAANLCPAPFVVSDTVSALTRDIDADASFQNRAKFSRMQEEAIQALAQYLHADADEIVITRNTSESNNTVLNAIDFRPGDEVVLWDQNHPTNNVAWDVRAQRWGIVVRRVATPRDPRTEQELVRPFIEALTRRTRVLSFSHISNSSGVRLPAEALCAEAKRRGVLTLIDGAQAMGAIALDLHALDCDFYTASAHKWLLGPKEAGVLFVRKQLSASLWPSIVGVGWDQAKDRGARRFGTFGQRDDATIAAVGRTIAFHQAIGPARIQDRVLELASALKRRLRERVPAVTFHTPLDPALSAGVVVFGVPGLEPRPAYQALYETHGIAGATAGGGFSGIRLCPHIYNPLADVERAVEAVASLLPR
jgi:selenocysteine lyase/cysteine desulfurase